MEKANKRMIDMAVASERVEKLKRANIKYFLNRNGSVENYRLITVDYPSDINALHLRDVKRWLSELGGKDSVNSFTWSYKKSYKNGYKWIDLKDDDTITPISNDDYIIRATILQFHSFPDKADEKPLLDNGSFIKSQHKSENADRRLTNFKVDASSTTNRKVNEKRQKRKSTTNVCCNILGCAKSDANDSALFSPSKVGRSGPHGKRSGRDVPHQQRTKYKLMGAPSCGQCGRRFEPEKLHLHMQSCKASKIREKEGDGLKCKRM